MALTIEQSNQLKDYFPVRAHEFLNGATYLSEEAITDRLDEVDPSWEFHRLGDFAYRENYVIATFRMTVGGVSRDGIGMWDLKMKKKDGNIIDAVDPEKSVSTDALKRAARLFGIGRYILEMGRAVSDERSLVDWLAKRQNVNTKTGEIKLVKNGIQTDEKGSNSSAVQKSDPDPITPQTPAETAKSALAGNGAPANGEKKVIGRWAFDRSALLTQLATWAKDLSYQERNNAVKAMDTEGAFANCADIGEATQLVLARLATHKKEQPA